MLIKNVDLALKIHPFIFYNPLIRRSGHGGAGAYPAVLRREVGNTLDRSPVHHRATQRQTTTHCYGQF